MKALNRFLGFVLWVIVLAIGVWLMAGCLGYELQEISAALAEKSARMLFGVILVLLVVVYWISFIPVSKEERAVSYEGEGGKVSVSVSAINSLLSRLAEEFAAIVSLKAAVNPKDKSVQMDVVVKSGAKLQELSQALQQKARENMEGSLGISDVGSIRVFVREIVMPDSSEAKDKDSHGDWQNMPI
jgi:uncharacterized alkaline shock family protein YloU